MEENILYFELDDNNFVVGLSEYNDFIGVSDNFKSYEFDSLEEKKEFMSIFTKYKLQNGELLKDETNYNILELNKKTDFFRNYRNNIFIKKWDVLKTNIAVGLEDPLTEEEIQWYNEMKDFPESITKDTTEDDYPVTPNRINNY